MNDIINRAKSHYETLASSPTKVDIPEWKEEGDKDTPCIYFTPLTLKDKTVINRYVKHSDELAAEVLIEKARDVAGKKIFTREHKQDMLRKMDSVVLERIANLIIGASDDERFEEAEKN